jgi:NAD+ diphosphatase
MLGFQARYAAGEIQVDGTEVETAGWYPAGDMPMIFPGNVSIAQWLIRDFLERHR